jgi:hypothetical protein
MTADGYILEPGERETHALLVPVSKAAAYLLRLSIHGCSHAGPMSRLGYAHRRCMTAQGPDLWQTTTLAYTSKVEGKAQ